MAHLSSDGGVLGEVVHGHGASDFRRLVDVLDDHVDFKDTCLHRSVVDGVHDLNGPHGHVVVIVAARIGRVLEIRGVGEL